ncbi:hypothetical protein TWF694_011555 [Orbilia ellipsospora]|uniref:Uncharacterized protein n=1 Tax=Orbilia ellipsospora TaxID=2528407 RepID=A0AAV9XBS8_9PEZI
MSIFESFTALDDYCQNGWFYYDWGWLDAELNGHSGYIKRDANVTDESHSSLLKKYEMSKKTWNTTESPPRRERKRPKTLPEGAQKESENFPPPVPGRSQNELWVLRLVVLGVRMMEAVENAFQDMCIDLMYDAYNNYGRAVIGNGRKSTWGDGSELTITLSFFASSVTNLWTWHDFLSVFGNDGFQVAQMILTCVNNFNYYGATTGIYNINDQWGNIIIQIALNGLRPWAT